MIVLSLPIRKERQKRQIKGWFKYICECVHAHVYAYAPEGSLHRRSSVGAHAVSKPSIDFSQYSLNIVVQGLSSLIFVQYLKNPDQEEEKVDYLYHLTVWKKHNDRKCSPIEGKMTRWCCGIAVAWGSMGVIVGVEDDRDMKTVLS